MSESGLCLLFIVAYTMFINRVSDRVPTVQFIILIWKRFLHFKVAAASGHCMRIGSNFCKASCECLVKALA